MKRGGSPRRAGEARSIVEELDRWRRVGDPPADAVLEALEARGERGRDLLDACARLSSRGDPRCAAFLDGARHPPSWARPEEHAAAHRLFARNGPWILMLGFPVLIDSYAGANDNKVLAMSGRLAGSGAFVRLVETARFVGSVCTPGALEAERAGWRSILAVRLLHAWVRRLCKRAGYDVALYDEPINQEAMCGTLMLFGHGVLTCLRRMGVDVSDEEAESWHALWRHVGYLLGVHPDLLPARYAGEVALYERIKAHQYRPDADTLTLFEAAARDVPRGARERMPLWFKALGGWTLQSRRFLEQLTVRCVDPVLWRHLGLRPSLPYTVAFEAMALAQRTYAQAYRRSRAVDIAGSAFMGMLARRLPPVLAGTRAEPSYDDPGFPELRRAS